MDRLIRAQGTDLVPFHAMRRPGQSVQQAKQEYENLLKSLEKQSSDALSGTSCGDLAEAIVGLGAMIHAISDSHSPAHQGFQEWPGLIGSDGTHGWPGTQLRHGDGKSSIENLNAYNKFSPLLKDLMMRDLEKRLAALVKKIKSACAAAR